MKQIKANNSLEHRLVERQKLEEELKAADINADLTQAVKEEEADALDD